MLSENPFEQFDIWYAEAEQQCSLYPNPVTVATVDSSGQPFARTVLLKGFDARGFCFYSNYHSRKGQQLQANPKASLCLYWEELERQVIIIGSVSKMSAAESDAYFASRPKGSQIGAHVSAQSEIIENREVLEQSINQLSLKYADIEVPRPPHWGGYRLIPTSMEFWQGQPDRLHDRFVYNLSGHNWTIQRLAP